MIGSLPPPNTLRKVEKLFSRHDHGSVPSIQLFHKFFRLDCFAIGTFGAVNETPCNFSAETFFSFSILLFNLFGSKALISLLVFEGEHPFGFFMLCHADSCAFEFMSTFSIIIVVEHMAVHIIDGTCSRNNLFAINISKNDTRKLLREILKNLPIDKIQRQYVLRRCECAV